MKIVKLRGVHYLSYKGITLTMNQPFIEATDEVLNTLSEYIKLGFLEIKEKDEGDKTDEYEPTDMSMEEAMYEDDGEIENIERYPSLEELQGMTKKELFEVLDKYQIKYQQTMKKDELIKLILA